MGSVLVPDERDGMPDLQYEPIGIERRDSKGAGMTLANFFHAVSIVVSALVIVGAFLLLNDLRLRYNGWRRTRILKERGGEKR